LVLWVSMIHVFFEVRTCFSGGKTAGRTGWRWRKRRRFACRFGALEGGAGYMQVGNRYPNDDSASHDLSIGT
jgi:hypothetical protein